MQGPAITLEAAFTLLDYAGVAVFAASGALAAAQGKNTIVTFAFFAAITGVGGGTLRDLLIGVPVFWVRDTATLSVCLAMALAVWVTQAERWPFATLAWLDAAGLAVYSVLGAAKAAAAGVPVIACIVMGVLTASFGGIVRDVLAARPSILLRREIYVSAAALAATVFLALDAAGVPAFAAGLIGALSGFMLRAGALLWGWALPEYGARDRRGQPLVAD